MPRKQKKTSVDKFPRKAVPIVQGETERETARNYAKMTTSPELLAYRVIHGVEATTRRIGSRYLPTAEERALVEQMSSVGIAQEPICLVIRDGVDDKTLRRHFRIFFVVSYCLFYKLSSSTC